MPFEPFSLIPTVLKTALGWIPSATKWTYNKTRLKVFQLRKKQWIDEESAIKYAQLTLGGSIKKAVAFSNYKSGRKLIAALRANSDSKDDYYFEVCLLEKIGGSFSVLWRYETGGINLDSFKIEDVTKDGFFSITFITESHGTGFGQRNLYVYSTKLNQLSSVTEEYTYALATGPDYSPVLENLDDEEYKEKVINYALSRGMLYDIALPDFSDPRYAVHRWHKENSDFVTGKIKVYRYEGEPDYGSSIVDVAEVGNTRWIAHFKGPLFKYNKKENNYYIVYSPLNVYEWAKSIVGNETELFFICHSLSVIYFYNSNSKELIRFCGYNSKPLPFADALTMENKSLLLTSYEWNDNFQLVISDLQKLIRCEKWCQNLYPHLPNGCSKSNEEDVNISEDESN